MVGAFIRRMRRVTMTDKNRSPRWEDEAPSGWARHKSEPLAANRITTKFYKAYQDTRKSYN
jgi:hypothetical protein